MFDFPGDYHSNRILCPQITEDALFGELGGFPKINFFDSAQFAEFVGWPKMFDNVSFFSEIIQDVDP